MQLNRQRGLSKTKRKGRHQYLDGAVESDALPREDGGPTVVVRSPIAVEQDRPGGVGPRAGRVGGGRGSQPEGEDVPSLVIGGVPTLQQLHLVVVGRRLGTGEGFSLGLIGVAV